MNGGLCICLFLYLEETNGMHCKNRNEGVERINSLPVKARLVEKPF